MANHDEVKVDSNGKPQDPSRRQFVNQALAVSAGVALSGFLPHLKAAPFQPFAGCAPPSPNELINPGEITANGAGLLQATVRVKDELRSVPNDLNKYTLRAYMGYKGHNTNPANLVTKTGVYSPGPTLRAPVGGELQIALLNHINPGQFPESPEGACDISQNQSGDQIYPDNPNPTGTGAQTDKNPDCFRGSNHTNMHFHGTHVSPNAFSDNVLIAIAPDLKAKAEDCDPLWKYACQEITCPQDWLHLAPAIETGLMQMIEQNNTRLRALPAEKKDAQLHIREAEQNKKLVSYQEFPQNWSGCFPYCIRPPKFGPPWKMGQSPGTHWYHAHKHGSTSIQVYNGMAGALILEGDYDKTLKATMPGIEQKIMVIQQFAEQPNKERNGGPGVSGGGTPGGPQAYLVNGQSQPVVTMQTNEIQWWRIINASVQGTKGQFIFQFVPLSPPAQMSFRQIAQDGVQFAWPNYDNQIAHPPIWLVAAPGNRVDILVKAPATPGKSSLQLLAPAGSQKGPIVSVNVVAGTATCNTKWPQTQAEYPVMPPFLADITSWSEDRTLKYQMCAKGSTPMINGVTFQEGIVNEAMLLDTKQQWTIENWSTGAAPTGGSPLHPFHIHINPFQLVEIFDPTNAFGVLINNLGPMFGDWTKAKKNPNGSFSLPQPWIWWDVFPLPLGTSTNTTPCPPDSSVTPGYIKFRTWFADFAGKFVDHCHILAHEDRGMMQLVEVYCNKTVVTHH